MFGNRWPRALVTLSRPSASSAFSFVPLMPVFARDALRLEPAATASLVSGYRDRGGRRRVLHGRLRMTGCASPAWCSGRPAVRRRTVAASSRAEFLRLSLVLFTLTGRVMALNGIAANTMLQSEAPDELRGRVMGFYSFMVLGLAPFGSLQAGWIAEHYRGAFRLCHRGCGLSAGGGECRRGAWGREAGGARAVAEGRTGEDGNGRGGGKFAMLITVSRQYGAGGSEVARRVAEALGWRVVDNELVEESQRGRGSRARKSRNGRNGCPVSLSGWPGRWPPPLPSCFRRRRRRHVPKLQEADLVRITETVVAEVAAKGQSGAGGPGGARGARAGSTTACT